MLQSSVPSSQTFSTNVNKVIDYFLLTGRVSWTYCRAEEWRRTRADADTKVQQRVTRQFWAEERPRERRLLLNEAPHEKDCGNQWEPRPGPLRLRQAPSYSAVKKSDCFNFLITTWEMNLFKNWEGPAGYIGLVGWHVSRLPVIRSRRPHFEGWVLIFVFTHLSAAPLFLSPLAFFSVFQKHHLPSVSTCWTTLLSHK